MKKLLGLALGFAMVAWTITPVFANNVTCGTLCTATVTIGSQAFIAPVTVNGDTGVGTISNFIATGAGGSTATIQSLTLNPDPGVIFAVAATNLTGSPQTFAFAFSTPIALSGTINAASSIGYTLTDGNAILGGGVGVSIAPFSGTSILVANDFTAALQGTNKGVDVGPAASGGIGTCGAFVGATSNCGPYAATHTFTGGPFASMGVVVAFVLTADDSAGLSGSVNQVSAPVPEPTTLLLLGSGLLGLAGWRRYSSRG